MMQFKTWLQAKWQVGGRPILIVGHGRSGTTWVGRVISAARRVLYYFEPCHRAASDRGNYDLWFRYARPGAHDGLLEGLLDPVFRGLPAPSKQWNRAAWHRWLPGYRVAVKEVASLLSIEWLAARYRPQILVVVRHPCAVALSELAQGVSPARSLAAILRQRELFEDHLGPYRTLIEGAATPFEILGAIWAARHRVVANALARHPDWEIVCYEDLCLDAVGQFRRLFRRFDLLWTQAMEQYVVDHSAVHRAGAYSGRRISALQADKWKGEIAAEDAAAVRRYVAPFDLPFYRSDAGWTLDGGIAP